MVSGLVSVVSIDRSLLSPGQTHTCTSLKAFAQELKLTNQLALLAKTSQILGFRLLYYTVNGSNLIISKEAMFRKAEDEELRIVLDKNRIKTLVCGEENAVGIFFPFREESLP